MEDRNVWSVQEVMKVAGWKWIAGVALAVLTLACGSSRSARDGDARSSGGAVGANGGPEAPADPTPAVSSNGTDWFEAKTGEIGLSFVHFNGMSGKYYFPEMIPPGVGLFDYDNDGDLDAYLVQSSRLGEASSSALPAWPSEAPTGGRLFRNDLTVRPDGSRDVRFTDVTAASGIVAQQYGMGVAAADMDNDGCVDLYLTNFGTSQLYRNNCDGTFTDVTVQSGVGAPGWGVSASFVDYDRDGWLDLYVGTYVQYRVQNDRRCTGLTGGQDYCPPSVYPPQADYLFHNEGRGTFVDVTAKALQGGPFGPALGVVSADFDNDGWLDIYVANDGKENLLWMNQRNGTFKNLGLLSGSALSGDGKAEASMGVDAGDFDNDGDEDLFMTHLPAEGNNLYVNDATGLFEDRSALSGLGPSSLGYSGFGTAWFDIDNDGWLDLLTANGAIERARGREADAFPYAEKNLLFRNLGNGRFGNVSAAAGRAFSLNEVSRGAAFGDVDNDGDIDVLLGQVNGPARLLFNTASSRNHWVGLRLVGRRPARDMLGARVEIVRSDGRTLWRRARADGSFASANDPRVLAGLGEASGAPTVRVRWPDGKTEEWVGVMVDAWTTLTEGEGRSQ